MGKTNSKRLLCLILSLAMVFMLISVPVYADDDDTEEVTEEVTDVSDDSGTESDDSDEDLGTSEDANESADKEEDADEDDSSGSEANENLISVASVEETDGSSETTDTADTSWYTANSGETSYTISTAAALAGLASLVNDGTDFDGITVTLDGDIDLSGYSDWTPIGNGTRSGSGYTGNAFKGTFDGNEKTISGLTITSGSGDAAIGLFGVLNGGTVTNFTLTNVSITATGSELAGAAVGLMVGGATVSGITVGAESGDTSAITVAKGAGVVGRMTISGTISDCTNYATVTGSGANVGGIVSAAYYTAEDSTMTISDCYNYGQVSGTTAVGGIVGLSAAEVDSCGNYEAISGSGTSIGGIVGEQKNSGKITGCENTAAVTNSSSADSAYGTGGIAGWVRYPSGDSTSHPKAEIIKVTGNTNSGSISGGNDGGGIVGTLYNAGVVTGNINNAASISGTTFAAGIVGNIQSDSSNKYSGEEDITVTGNISTTSTNSISAECKDAYAYNNLQSNSGVVVSNNGEEFVAAIGDTQYVSLAAAVEAAQSGDTVTLLKNTSGSGIVIGSIDGQCDFTIDFGGYTYTVDSDPLAGSSGTKSQCFQLLKATGSLTMKNGTIAADNSNVKMMIQNYCDLTLENMTLDATKGTNNISYVLSNNCGDVTITGSTTITASDGAVAFDVYYWPNGGYGDGVSVTIDSEDVTINGTIEYGSDGTSAGISGVAENASLTISAGTVNGSISVYNLDTDGETGIAITGGTFSSDVSAYCSLGYAATEDESGKYTVAVDEQYVASVTNANGTVTGVYKSLQEAFDAAALGSTVTLLQDITLTEQVTILYNLSNITLDGDGHTITCATTTDPSQSGVSALYFGGSDGNGKTYYCTGVTIKNLTMTGTARFGIMLYGGTSSVLENVTISGNYYYAINFYGTHGATMTNCNISNSYVSDINEGGMAVWSNAQTAYPIYLYNTTVSGIAINTYTSSVDYTKAKIFVYEGSKVETIYTYYDEEFYTENGLTPVSCFETDSTSTVGTVYYDDEETGWTKYAVAQIGDETYYTLEEAVAAANEAESAVTITMLSNAALDSSVTFSNTNTITLDLNGKAITRGDSTTTELISVASGSSLVVTDSSDDQDGSIDATFVIDGTTYTSYGIRSYGELTIEAGTISGSFGIRMSGGNAEIKSGTVSGSSRGISIDSAAANGKLTISGGTIEGTSSTSYGIVQFAGEIEITGGTITGNMYGIQAGGTLTVDGEDVVISGSSVGIYCTGASASAEIISGTVEGGAVAVAAVSGGKVTIGTKGSETGPTITGGSEIIEMNTQSSATASAEVTIYSGTLTGDYYGICVFGYNSTYYSKLNIYGGTITAEIFAISGNGTTGRGHDEIYIYGGTITSNKAQAIYHPQQEGKMYVYGGTITGDTGIEVRGGTVVIDDEADATAPLVIKATGTPTGSDGNNSGSTTSGAAVAVATYNLSDISVTIKSGTLVGASSVYESNPNNYETLTKEVKVDITGGDFTGDVYSEDEVIEITNGTFDEAPELVYCAEGYAPVYDEASGKYTVSTAVAAIYDADGSYVSAYETLTAAFAAAEEGDTVKLVGAVTESAEFASSNAVKLDLNGYELTSDAAYTISITGEGELTILDSSEDGDGAVYNTKSGGNAIYVDNSSATLNVESGTIKAVGVAINVNAGNVNLEGGTFEGGAALTEGASAVESTLCLKTASTDTCAVTVTGGFYIGYAFAMPSGATTSPISVSSGYYTVSNWSVNNHLASGCSIVDDTTYDGYSYTVTAMAIVVGYYDTEGNFTAVKGYSSAYMYNALTYASTLISTLELSDNQTAGIVLNADYTDKTITIPADATIILDLNGFTVGDGEAVRSAIAVSVGASLTIIDSSNGSGTVTSANTAGGTIRNYGGTLVIEDGTFINNDQTQKYSPVIYSAVATSGSANVTSDTVSTTINGGTYSSYGRIVHLNIGELTVNGGVFTAKAIHYAATDAKVYDYTSIKIATDTVEDDTGTRTLYTYVVNRVASVTSGDTVTYYETLSEAIEAAADGDTVTLLTDVELDSALNITSGSFTLDLGGCTLTGRVNIKSGADVTIQNGTMTNPNGQALNVYASGDSSDATTVVLTETAVIKDAGYGLCVFPTDNTTGNGEGVVVTVDGSISATSGIFVSGNIKSCTDSDIITVNGTVTGADSTATVGSDSAGIAINGAENVVIGSTAVVSGATGVEVRAGSLTVEDGATISATVDTFAILANSSGSTTVGAGIAVVQHTTNLPISVTINGGDISGAYAIYEQDIQDNDPTDVSIKITGGTFTGTTEAVYAEDSDVIAIYAGSFSTVVDADYCAGGYVPTTVADDDGMYTVTPFKLGVSTDSAASVATTSVVNYGESVMYVGVSAENISTYYDTENYPTTAATFTDDEGNVHNYIFAGWYEDSEGTTACTSTPTSDAYAKFVDEDVLKVICVFTPVATAKTGNFWRFISSMDTAGYIAYQIKITDSEGNEVSTIDSANMRRTTATYTLTSISRKFVAETDFSSASNYIVTGSYTDTNASGYYDSLTATVEWTREDGTVVIGPSYTFSSNNASTTTELTGVKAE